MPVLHVVRVFVGEGGAGGNPLGVFLDGAEVPEVERQRIATDLGFSETVFVDDPARGEMRLYTPATELPFAGHPTVGTAWLLRREGHDVDVLRPPAGEVGVRERDDLVWIDARPEWAPDDIDMIQLDAPGDVHALDAPLGERGASFCWAWDDEEAGRIRARGLYPSLGIAEDEATGAAALALCAELGRPIEVRQGRGSLIRARPRRDGRVEVGGVTELAELRDFAL
jgi:predicted PhzF superfamily epimerase YddE/YHI9